MNHKGRVVHSGVGHSPSLLLFYYTLGNSVTVALMTKYGITNEWTEFVWRALIGTLAPSPSTVKLIIVNGEKV